MSRSFHVLEYIKSVGVASDIDVKAENMDEAEVCIMGYARLYGDLSGISMDYNGQWGTHLEHGRLYL